MEEKLIIFMGLQSKMIHVILGNQFRAALNAAHDGYISLSIVRDLSDRYFNEFSIRVIDETQNVSDKVQAQVDRLVCHINQTARRLSKQIYNELKTEYNYLNNDESVTVTLQANDYRFNVFGDQI